MLGEFFALRIFVGPGQCGSGGSALSHALRGHSFDSSLWHLLWLWPWFPTRGLGGEGSCRRQPINVSLALKSIKHGGWRVLVGGRTFNLKVNGSLFCIFWGHLTFTALPQQPGLGRARGPQLLPVSRGWQRQVQLERLFPGHWSLDKLQGLRPRWSPREQLCGWNSGCSGLWSLRPGPLGLSVRCLVYFNNFLFGLQLRTFT